MKYWPDGTPISVVTLNTDNPTHQAFTKSFLGYFAYQLPRDWDRSIFSARGVAPTVVKNETEMLEIVLGTKGAIGYIPSTHPLDSEQVKTIEIHQ